MQPVLSNRVVLMAAILSAGACIASGLVASALWARTEPPAAMEPGFWGADSRPDINLDLLAYSSVPGDISTVRAFMP